MGKTLKQIAETLKNNNKVQLIYAFNGIGKTRLSCEFKEFVSSKASGDESPMKVIYYNAFTEDLFYWDNDLKEDTKRELLIHPNKFIYWVFKEQGQENNVINLFQHYVNGKLTPRFSENYNKITFTIDGGNNGIIDGIKISKGEESCLIWCTFYCLLAQIIDILNVPEPEERETDRFNELEYVFIDDPVSSLDENHLIELAVNVSNLIHSSQSGLKFIITTHNPLFYNVLYNELGLNRKWEKHCFLLERNDDGSYVLEEKPGDSNKSFSYHLYLINILKKAIVNNNIAKYHFMLLRNIYEKTANFLGYPRWSDLLPDDKKTYYNRIIQFTSHSTLSNETIPDPTEPEKQTLKLLLEHIIDNHYYKEE